MVVLIDIDNIAYALPGQRASVRPCRTWRLDDGSTVTVVTELPGSDGTDVTNGAEAVRDTVEDLWGTGCRIIEHHPRDDRDDYTEQFPDQGSLDWEPLDPGDVLAVLGPDLERTSPAPRQRSTSGAV